MKHFTVLELNTIKYKKITGSSPAVVGGTRPRLTLVHKDTNQKFFFKTYTHNAREVWAECLASHIAKLVGIPAQLVTIKTAPSVLANFMTRHYGEVLGKSWKPIGTLARNIFTKNIDITYGSAIVGNLNTPLTLTDIEERIKKRYYGAEDLLQSFTDMVVFDVLIGNMDRHHENWGVCEDKKYRQQLLFDKKQLISLRNFTPLFDHGSSLMFELSDEDVEKLHNNEERLMHYVEGAKFGFILDPEGNEANPFKLLEEYVSVNKDWTRRIKLSLEKIKKLDLLALAELIIQMPIIDDLEYSLERRKLLYKSLLLRYTKLISLYESM